MNKRKLEADRQFPAESYITPKNSPMKFAASDHSEVKPIIFDIDDKLSDDKLSRKFKSFLNLHKIKTNKLASAKKTQEKVPAKRQKFK